MVMWISLSSSFLGEVISCQASMHARNYLLGNAIVGCPMATVVTLCCLSTLHTSTLARNRYCSSDSSFFKSWNPCMAYWLGFLFADGNINDSRAHYVVQLHLKCIDYSHVEKFKKALESTYRLALHKNGETSKSCSVSHKINNHSMAQDLIALGCT
eukprot:635890_1